jgi:NADPH-dependent curcumin reductase CurA
VARDLSKDFRAVAEIVEVPTPPPASDEVLVKHLYAGVNATDVNISAGLYTPGAKPPLDLGGEILGQVAAVGEAVSMYQVGDYVVATSLGGYSEYGLHKARYLVPVDAPKPEYLSLIISGLTAAIGLNVTGEMKSGETVLVTAAAGGTGQFAVQLAKMAGCHVIGTCSSDDKVAFLKHLGCDRPLNYKKERLGDVLRAEYPKGVDLIYESVGGELFDVCVKNLALRGRLVVIGYITEYLRPAPEKVEDVRIYHRLLMKSASIRSMFLPHFMSYALEHIPRLMGLYQGGNLHIALDPRPFHGLESVADAVEYLHSGLSTGKVLVNLT